MVIPVRDEERNVRPLHAELSGVLRTLGFEYETIFIDDGSRDRTFEELSAIQRSDPRLRVIQFTQSFGQTAAFAAGFAHARGRLIVTSDGDLQNDPADIPRLLELASSHDIVSGWRRKRKDNTLTREVPSVVANWLISLITGIRLHDVGCSLKVYRAEVVKPLQLRPGMHRYLPAFASRLGGRVAELEVHHRPRRHGQSKYGLSRTLGVVADLVQLRTLMRQVTMPPPGNLTPIYEIRQILEHVG